MCELTNKKEGNTTEVKDSRMSFESKTTEVIVNLRPGGRGGEQLDMREQRPLLRWSEGEGPRGLVQTLKG